MTATPPLDPPPETVDTIILLSVDSLRLDRIHAERNGKQLMPAVTALAEEAVEFETGISPGPATADSVPAMLTGAYPSQFSGFSLPPAGSEPRTIAERLADRGFTSAAFHQNNLITRRYNFDRGFDHYYDISEETREETGQGTWRLKVRNLIEDTPLMKVARWVQTQAMERFGKSLYVLDEPGDSLTDRALDWLDDAESKRFLWMHYMDTHHPYLSPPEVQRRFGREIPEERLLQLSRKARSDAETLTDEEVEDLVYAYDCAVRFVDEQIRRVIDHLEDTGHLDDAMVVVTADHGEEFMEHGEFGHRTSLWDELITVPLIVKHPDVKARTVEGQAPVQLIPDTLVEGTGLFEAVNGGVEYVVAETSAGRDGIRCCRGNGFKLVLDGDERIVTRIDEDGERVVTDSEVSDDVLDELEERLDETHESYGDTGDIDEEALREDLAALGYLDE
ncbi:MAG: sulfatase [Halobacteriales archaeon]